MSKSEDELFAEIVDNYGDRPALPDPRRTMKNPAPEGTSFLDYEEKFVPDEPAPLPQVSTQRFLTWGGLLLAPLLALLGATGVLNVPGWGVGVLVAWFIGSVAFLLTQLPREPREPWDSGAQV